MPSSAPAAGLLGHAAADEHHHSGDRKEGEQPAPGEQDPLHLGDISNG